MNRHAIQLVCNIPSITVGLGVFFLTSRSEPRIVETTGAAWLLMLAAIIASIFGVFLLSRYLQACFGAGTTGKIVNFLARLVGFAMVFPVSLLITEWFCPDNVICNYPLTGFVLAASLSAANVISQGLEQLFVSSR